MEASTVNIFSEKKWREKAHAGFVKEDRFYKFYAEKSGGR
jgi:hypothetical protein